MCAVKVINRRKVGASVLDHELGVLRTVKERVICDSIVKIVDIFDDAFLVYIVMEYMGGGDLRSRILQNGPFSGCYEAFH